MATDIERRFHETWLGMVQPIEGLVVSIPALLEAQCFERHHASVQHEFLEHLDEDHESVPNLEQFFADVLDLMPDLFDRDDEIPEGLGLWVPEGHQFLRPTAALRHIDADERSAGLEEASSPATAAGERYVMLVWDLPEGLELDKPETSTGEWHYPPAAKFERLLRHCRVPIGLLTNRREFRLVYAPHGESSGSITLRIADMASVGGRPILDAFLMLLSARRFFGVGENRQLPAILKESRNRQADVTNALAGQVFEGLEILLAGFEAAAARDPDYRTLLEDALKAEDDHLYGGLLTVMLRLVFLLYVEDRGLVPVENDLYAEHLSVLGLFDQLQHDAGEFPDTMARRFGAWPRLLATFRAVFLGADYPGFHMPPRRGRLFDPEAYPFLEGWPRAGGAPIKLAEERAKVQTPPIDDKTIYEVLQKLIVLDGQRLSYQELSVEQIGSVYENLMGYHVVRVPGDAVKTKDAGVWISAEEVLTEPKNRRKAWLKDEAGFTNGHAKSLASSINEVDEDKSAVLDAVAEYARSKTKRAPAGGLVLQPGEERRRTSSHYTPRTLTESLVRRTMEPLLATMGDAPSSETLLSLKVCDPAMGSGAFLVEACRFLADEVVAAWSREGLLEDIASQVDDAVNHARRLVAQQCLYGVDKNPFAVDLAKLSMWLVTLAKDEPFTFLDHALRHGDSLVGLSLEQLRGFHWKPRKQLMLCAREIEATINKSVELRQRILALADESGPEVTRQKEWLLQSAEDALERARLIGDLIIGAFFAESKKSDREKALNRRLGLVEEWLRDGVPPPDQLLEMQVQTLSQAPTFHWMLEFPEVFYAARPDPLQGGERNRAACMDAFVGNPPFMGGRRVRDAIGDEYTEWLEELHGASKNSDLSSHFFRRSAGLLGHHGTIGLIATNTIAQGNTREAGLRHLLRNSFEIYSAETDMDWPVRGVNVTISVINLAVGSPAESVSEKVFNGLPVQAINSRLRPKPERRDPVKLKSNAGGAFVGTIVLGTEFVLTAAQREAFLRADPRNASRIHPYIGGQEVNSMPSHRVERYVIDVSDLQEDTLAREWPSLYEHLLERVRPQRVSMKNTAAHEEWWKHWRSRPALYDSLEPLDRCIVRSLTSKHHSCFTFLPVGWVYDQTLFVFPYDSGDMLGVLVSRVHEFWCRLVGGTLKKDPRYNSTRCFDPFPFPTPDRYCRVVLADLGDAVDESRREFMRTQDIGLTETYNLLNDPTCDNAEIVKLRRLHAEVDRAVLAAYGWADVSVPPYGTPSTPEEAKALQGFEDEVIDRLFVLNAKRAEEERLLGSSDGKGAKPR